MTDNMQRARELLAAECRAEKMGPVATAIEQGMHVSGFADIALRAIEAAMRLSAGADWQPIETAPDGEPVVVFWRELHDPYDTARYGLDVLEDGVWNHHEECHQHFLSVAPPGSHGPSESAPYTHWMKLGAPLPAAPRHEPGEG